MMFYIVLKNAWIKRKNFINFYDDKKKKDSGPVGIGMSGKQMRRKNQLI